MLTLQAYLSEETGIQHTHLLLSIYKNQAVTTELQPKRNSKEHLSPVSLIHRQAQPDQFSSNLSSKFSRKRTQNFLSNLLHGLTTLKFTPFSVHGLAHPHCMVGVLFCAILLVAIKNNGLSSFLLSPFTSSRLTPALILLSSIQYKPNFFRPIPVNISWIFAKFNSCN